MDLIERQKAIDAFDAQCWERINIPISKEIRNAAKDTIKALLAVQPQEIIRCGECKYQLKHFYPDRRRKDGGTYVYGCELAEGYSHVCLDDEFCSRAERKTDEGD